MSLRSRFATTFPRSFQTRIPSSSVSTVPRWVSHSPIVSVSSRTFVTFQNNINNNTRPSCSCHQCSQCTSRWARSFSTTKPSFAVDTPTPPSKPTDFNALSWKSFVAIGLSGIGLLAYFNYEKKEAEARRSASTNAATGKPLVGGPFSLVDHFGRPVTDLDFRGKWMLLYFGYTFCPDVCPDELDKIAAVVDELKKHKEIASETIVPIFISCDPKRDSISVIRDYLKEFHPDFLGMTGTYQQIKRAAKSYRLYFSAPPKSLDEDDADYLVDHSIFFYLVNPDGQYVAHFGKPDEPEQVVEKCLEKMKEFKQNRA